MDKSEIFNLLVKYTKENIVDLFEEIPNITEDTHFVELGASSCDRAAIAADTLDSLSLKSSVENILNAATLGEMTELIYSRSAMR